MGIILTYALKSSIFLCLGYLTYKWAMAGERQHSLNRIILYTIICLSLLLPALSGKWEMAGLSTDNSFAGEFEIEMPIESGLVKPVALPVDTPSMILRVIVGIYLSGMLVMFIFAIYNVLKILSIIKNGKQIKKNGYTLVLINREDISPFSYLSYYVMSRKDYIAARDVISIHERQHLKLHHWIDLMIVQILEIFQWFNPAAWLIGEEFKTIHEYQADEAVINSGVNLKEYQTLLVKKAVGTRFQSLANSLNHSKLKKRVTMMYKSRPSKTRRIGALLLVPALGIGCALVEIPAVAKVFNETSEVSFSYPENIGKVNEFFPNEEMTTPAISQKENDTNFAITSGSALSVVTTTDNTEAESGNVMNLDETNAKPIVPESTVTEPVSSTDGSDLSSNEITGNTEKKDSVMIKSDKPQKRTDVSMAVEKSAEFPGDMTGLMKFLADNLKYPKEAYEKGIQGNVIIRFIVEKDGSTTDFQVMKGVDPLLDNEAIRVLKKMPKWEPAENGGKPVASYFHIPVRFKLNAEQAASSKAEDKTD